MGGDPSGGTGGSTVQKFFSGGGDNSLNRSQDIGETFDITSQDSVLGRAMYNENIGGNINEDALKDIGEGWWTRWKTGQLSEEESAWVQNNFGQGR